MWQHLATILRTRNIPSLHIHIWNIKLIQLPDRYILQHTTVWGTGYLFRSQLRSASRGAVSLAETISFGWGGALSDEVAIWRHLVVALLFWWGQCAIVCFWEVGGFSGGLHYWRGTVLRRDSIFQWSIWWEILSKDLITCGDFLARPYLVSIDHAILWGADDFVLGVCELAEEAHHLWTAIDIERYWQF